MSIDQLTFWSLVVAVIILNARFCGSIGRTPAPLVRQRMHLGFSVLGSFVLLLAYAWGLAVTFHVLGASRSLYVKSTVIALNVFVIAAIVTVLLVWHKAVLKRLNRATSGAQ